ncbi:MAG: radical SAM protein [Planctomycetes bacterium]|nr:radical SAM protein [Planctomycetota bacterium]
MSRQTASPRYSAQAELLGGLARVLAAPRRQATEPLDGLPPGELAADLSAGVGLYVHVPFCERLCRFCPYNRRLLESGLLGRYSAALRREIDLLAPAIRAARPGSLYIGGGTPTVVPELIEELASRARGLGLSSEIGVEVHPLHATPSMLARLRRAGVTYVSVGVQSFDDSVLRYLGRSHDAREGRRGLEAALAEGFGCVDADLVFDVVRFGPEGVVRDAEETFRLGVDQLSVYPMMRFGYTPVGRHKVHDERREKAALRRIERAGRNLSGYVRSSVWTFNRDPARRYTSITREHYVGMGPSGSSFLGRLFTVNTFDVETYARLLDSERLPVTVRARLSRPAAMAYYLFWRFYEGRADRGRFASLFGRRLERAFPGLFGLMRLLGLLARQGDAYLLTERGFEMFHTVERWVTYRFIEPLWAACRASPVPGPLRL